MKGNTAMATESLRKAITEIERNLCKNRVGVWEWSDEEDLDPDSYEDD